MTMTQELARPQMCLLMRNGVEIWIDEDKANLIGDDLTRGNAGIVKISGQFINTVEIVGLFDPIYLEEMHRKKRGEWKCKLGNWHTKNDKCECRPPIKPVVPEAEQTPEQRRKAREACEKVKKDLSKKFKF